MYEIKRALSFPSRSPLPVPDRFLLPAESSSAQERDFLNAPLSLPASFFPASTRHAPKLKRTNLSAWAGSSRISNWVGKPRKPPHLPKHPAENSICTCPLMHKPHTNLASICSWIFVFFPQHYFRNWCSLLRFPIALFLRLFGCFLGCLQVQCIARQLCVTGQCNGIRGWVQARSRRGGKATARKFRGKLASTFAYECPSCLFHDWLDHSPDSHRSFLVMNFRDPHPFFVRFEPITLNWTASWI